MTVKHGAPTEDVLTYTFGHTRHDLDMPILVDAAAPLRCLSTRQTVTEIKRVIAGLHALGIKAGDTVLVHSFNDIFYTVLFFAIIGVGGRFAGSNPAYTATELIHHFRVTDARLVICQRESLGPVLKAADQVGVARENILEFDLHTQRRQSATLAGIRSWTELFLHGERDWNTFDDDQTAQETIAVLMSTSGTTGLHKAAAISHQALTLNDSAIQDGQRKDYPVSRLICLPQFHAFASPLSHVGPFRNGVTTYVMARFMRDNFMRIVQDHQITEAPMVPAIITQFVKSLSSADQSGPLRSLRWVWSAGSPLEPSIQRAFEDLIHPTGCVAQVWGLTELGWVSTFKAPQRGIPGSVGMLLPLVEAKIVDDHGQEIVDAVATGTIGEICIRSPMRMRCYLAMPTETAYAFDDDGFYRTGDIGYCRYGAWYIISRIKDLIKVRGWQVSPSEIEAALLAHSSIADAAVVGITPPGKSSEVPRAYIVRANSSLTESDVHIWVGERLARYKALDGGVEFVDVIAKSSTGKILKAVLRESYARRIMSTAENTISV
ncbi:hypothetical protein V1525DRAFT_418218 [Lipomyces kononenkoae]|uniref:Uncharacterized protein n=1 Tax=Lipomyces kononenkoae TaxID=34357 RepID=A0ACC3T4A7_LIPKO